MSFLARVCPCFGPDAEEEEPQGNPVVTFSPKAHSAGCVLSNFCISGDGIGLANTQLLQTRAYFEVTVIELPDGADMRVGVGSSGCYVQPEWIHLGENGRSYAVPLYITGGNDDDNADDDDDSIKPVAATATTGGARRQFKEGDVIGVTLDLSEIPTVSFFKNGAPLPTWTQRTRGEMHPACSVSGGAMLEANFGHRPFAHGPPPKFDAVIFVKSII